MTVFIDPPRWPAHGTRFSHLVSDVDDAELHDLARRVGLPRRAFDLDHYDVPEARYADVIAAGARAFSGRALAARLAASGRRVKPAQRAETRRLRRLETLRASWAALAAPLGVPRETIGADARVGPGAHATAGADDAWRALGDELIERWSEPHRRYHDATHLHDVLLSLDELEDHGAEVTPVARVAAWFHDAVYEGAPGDDERASAELARERLGAFPVDTGVAELASRLVLATLPGAAVAPDDAAAALLDADLAILAAGSTRYRDYAQAVRAEYAHVPDAQFRPARARIMQGFLERPAIYLTPEGRELWERRARANVSAEVAQLLT